MGYKLAGYEVIGNCEIDPAINKMYVKNFHPKYNFNIPIQEFCSRDDIPEELFGVDILDGSPPCSTFSMAGKRDENWGKAKKFREGQAEQVLDDLFFHFIDVAELLKPKAVIAENVKGLVTGKARGYVNLIMKRFAEAGYDVQLFLLNSATMGVPQKRERCFFIARRKDLNLPKIILQFNEKPILYGEIASDNYKPIDQSTNMYKLWKNRRPGDRTLSDAAQRVQNRDMGYGYRYVYKDMVCPTITSHSKMILRFDVPGALADEDVIKVQTFPQDYDFCGNSVEYVCGMSVPPVMMKKIAAEVYRQWLAEK